MQGQTEETPTYVYERAFLFFSSSFPASVLRIIFCVFFLSPLAKRFISVVAKFGPPFPSFSFPFLCFFLQRATAIIIIIIPKRQGRQPITRKEKEKERERKQRQAEKQEQRLSR